MFPLFPENRKTIRKFVKDKKKSFQKCNPYFKFFTSKLTNKNFPIWCNVKFALLFVLLNAMKTDSKLTLYHMEIFLLFNFPRYNLKSGGFHISKFFTTKKLWDGLPEITESLSAH